MGRISDSKARLIQAALDLIVSNGFGAVSVDQICERSGVRKGSFYHFFPSKTDLAIAAFEEAWTTRALPFFEQVFHSDMPPLERLSRWCSEVYREQKEVFDATGHVPGCPFCSVGSEMAAQDERIRQKAEELLGRGLIHLERTLRDAQRERAIRIEDPVESARSLAAFVSGTVLQAKVRNDPEVLRGLDRAVLLFLGAPPPAPASARGKKAARSSSTSTRRSPSS